MAATQRIGLAEYELNPTVGVQQNPGDDKAYMSDLSRRVSELSGLNITQARFVLHCVWRAIAEEIASGAEVRISTFGTWRWSYRRPYMRRAKGFSGNLKKGEIYQVPGKWLLKFRPAKRLKSIAYDPPEFMDDKAEQRMYVGGKKPDPVHLDGERVEIPARAFEYPLRQSWRPSLIKGGADKAS